MGVISCSRNECKNIMCDTYIEFVGYICSDCIHEFKSYLNANEIHIEYESEIYKEVKKFMETAKAPFNYDKKMSVDAFFNDRNI